MKIKKIIKITIIVLLFITSLTIAQTYEDFVTDYTEVDQLGEINVGDTDNYDIVMTDLGRGSVSYVRKSFGADYFGDFTHEFEVFFSADDACTVIGFWAINNSSDDLAEMSADDDGMCLNYYDQCSGTPRLTLVDYTNDNLDQTAESYAYYPPNIYYFTITRDGTSLTCDIYSDASRETLIEQLSITCGTDTYEYYYPVMTHQSGSNNDRGLTYEIRNAELTVAGGSTKLIPLAKKYW